MIFPWSLFLPCFIKTLRGVKGSHSGNRFENGHTVPSVKKISVHATTAQVASYVILRASLPECHPCFVTMTCMHSKSFFCASLVFTESIYFFILKKYLFYLYIENIKNAAVNAYERAHADTHTHCPAPFPQRGCFWNFISFHTCLVPKQCVI